MDSTAIGNNNPIPSLLFRTIKVKGLSLCSNFKEATKSSSFREATKSNSMHHQVLLNYNQPQLHLFLT